MSLAHAVPRSALAPTRSTVDLRRERRPAGAPRRAAGERTPDGPAAALRRSFAALLGAALCALALGAPQSVRAQSLDTELPPVERGVLGEPQQIEADVGTEAEIARIDLFYRFDGEEDYRRLPMRESGVSGVYVATVPTRDVEAERLEFHILAEESGGGMLRKGNADAPLVRELEPPAGLLAEEAPSSEEESAWSGRRKYLYIALGVLAVGALAAAAGGGDDGSEGCGPEGCRLVVTLPPPGG